MNAQYFDGDIYAWRWKELPSHMPYHCKSQIAVVYNGRLRDTFWMHFNGKVPCVSDSCAILKLNEVELKLLGNIDTWIQINADDKHFYRPEDIIDMRHSNCSHAPVLLRDGAVKSEELSIKHLNSLIDERISEISVAVDRIKSLREQIRDIQRDSDD